MTYEILEIKDADAFVVRSADTPTISIEIPSLRDLLLLRSRLNEYADTLQPDDVIEDSYRRSTTTTPTNDADAPSLITLGDAAAIAKRAGYSVPAPTLKSAVYRGTIPGTFQQGRRWMIPKDAFVRWLNDWAEQQG